MFAFEPNDVSTPVFAYVVAAFAFEPNDVSTSVLVYVVAWFALLLFNNVSLSKLVYPVHELPPPPPLEFEHIPLLLN